MRKIVVCFLLAFLFLGCSADTKNNTPQKLLDHYLTYHRNKDLEGVMSLFYQEGTPPTILATVRETMKKNFSFAITGAEVGEIPPDKMKMIRKGYFFNGRTLLPNLEPLKQAVLKYDLTGQPKDHQARGSFILIGKKGDTYYFLLSKEKKEPLVVGKDAQTAAPDDGKPSGNLH